MIELFKTTRANMKFDRRILSGSSWLMGIRVQRVFDQGHAAMEPGKTIFISKFHEITGHTGEHLLKPTANYMKLKLIGRLPPCEVCAKAKIRQRIAIRKEIRSMIERGVWRKTDRKKIPNNRRLIGNKWVFKIKRDGTYRARLVALGYSQIPGMDYTDNFAPVAHDVSFKIALARMMVEKLDSLVMDVETAFLYGDIEEEIFMKSPIGMEEIDPGSSPEDCYQLKKGIYGLCQAARQFWKKFVDTIKKEPFGFTVSPADPCLLFKENNLGICIIIMYVDDMLIIGKKEKIE